MIKIVLTNYVVPSQNTRDKTHWADRKRENDKLMYLVRSQMSLDDICMNGHFRYIDLMCYRPRLIADDSNYRGGAKSLIDVLKRCGAISDDTDKLVSITYRQDLLRNAPNKRPLTIVRVDADPIQVEI